MSVDPELPAYEGLADMERFAVALALDAGALALSQFRCGTEIIDKAPSGVPLDPVTAADRAVEARLRAGIGERFPDHGVFGEEDVAAPGSSPWSWMIDPIDGTRGFVSGFLHWGMLLALRHGEQPIMGVVHQPFTGETWIGSSNGARFTRQGDARGLQTRSCSQLALATLASTDPYLFEDAEATAFDALRQTVRLTRFGSDCYAYCMLAMGQVDLVVESGLKPWDVQALMPLVNAAGGVITNWRGGDCRDGGQVVAAGDPLLHEKVLRVLAPAAHS